MPKNLLENFKSKFHRPLMRWNLLLHEWSLIFHIFVLCSWRPSDSSRRRSLWVNIFLVTRNTLSLKAVSILKMNWIRALSLKILPYSYARILPQSLKKSGLLGFQAGITKCRASYSITEKMQFILTCPGSWTSLYDIRHHFIFEYPVILFFSP